MSHQCTKKRLKSSQARLKSHHSEETIIFKQFFVFVRCYRYYAVAQSRTVPISHAKFK